MFLLFLLSFPSTQAAWLSTRRACPLGDTVYDVTYYPDSQTIAWVNSGVAAPDPNANVTVYSARACECGGRVSHCLILNQENYCSSPSFGSTRSPLCYHRTPLYSLILLFWGPLYFSFLILFVALFTTDCGKHARNYMFSKCFPCQNRRLIDRILSREARAREEMRRVLREAHERPDGMREQMSLQLKTKTLYFEHSSNDLDQNGERFVDDSPGTVGGGGEIYNFGHHHDDQQIGGHEHDPGKQKKSDVEESLKDGAEMCSICMVPLENGERVGDLDCGHHFHVDCLKTWVLWRNACPLCNSKNIAKTKVILVPREGGQGEDATVRNNNGNHSNGANANGRGDASLLQRVRNGGRGEGGAGVVWNGGLRRFFQRFRPTTTQ